MKAKPQRWGLQVCIKLQSDMSCVWRVWWLQQQGLAFNPKNTTKHRSNSVLAQICIIPGSSEIVDLRKETSSATFKVSIILNFILKHILINRGECSYHSSSEMLLFQDTGTVTEPQLVGTSTTQMLHLRLRKHHRRAEERLQVSEDQEICSKMVSPRNDREATHSWKLNKWLPKQDLNNVSKYTNMKSWNRVEPSV